MFGAWHSRLSTHINPETISNRWPTWLFAHLHFWPRVWPWCSSPSPCFESGIEHWCHGLLVFHSIKLVLFKGPSPKGGWLTIEHMTASARDKPIQTSQWHANIKSESEATDRNEDGSVGLFEPSDCESCFHSCFQSIWLVRFSFLLEFVYQLKCLWKERTGAQSHSDGTLPKCLKFSLMECFVLPSQPGDFKVLHRKGFTHTKQRDY